MNRSEVPEIEKVMSKGWRGYDPSSHQLHSVLKRKIRDIDKTYNLISRDVYFDEFCFFKIMFRPISADFLTFLEKRCGQI